ncbi:MAG: FAD-dependent oxidoreductase, partial [Thiohalobacteraceae bacterium]
MKQRLVLIGNGMAGVRTLEELLKLAPEAYEITVFGAEPYGNYNRILLSPVLAGEKTLEQIMLNDEPWYAEHDIRLHKGKYVGEIDRVKRRVRATDGTEAAYDRLILATGSVPFIIQLPGKDLPGVVAFRDVHDVDRMLAAAQGKGHAVVIGGGLLGLEVAHGLSKQGMQVSVVHLLDSLMEKQLDKPAAALLKRSLEGRGLKFMMGAQTEAILGTERVTGVRFKDGLEVAADLVVMAVGVRPNIALAKGAGLQCERGVLVNDTLQTYDPRIYAVGECVQHRDDTYGLVAPLFEQAKVCANHLARLGYARYQGSLTSTKLKVTGIDLFSAGDFVGDDTT